jgi:hypothetical protein
MWTHSRDLLGYDVEATDASIGTIDQASYDASDAYVVVDTGFWIFGRKRLMPAGAIASVDRDSESVHVTMTRQQVKSAPDYDSDDGDLVARSRRNDFYRSFLRQHRRHTIGSGPTPAGARSA